MMVMNKMLFLIAATPSGYIKRIFEDFIPFLP
jgi:hypothetical protein